MMRWLGFLIVLELFVASGAYAQELSRGHQILIEKGFQVQALVASVPGGLSDARWAESNFTSPMLVGGITADSPPASGGLFGRFNLGVSSTPLMAGEDASQLLNLQFRDEQPLNAANIQEAATVLSQWRSQYPQTLGFTNQYGYQELPATLRSYMQQAQPDMLMFDTYPFTGTIPNGGYHSWYRHLDKYRMLGLEGNDGTGNQPIPTGVFLQTWMPNDYVLSESEIRLNQFSAWAFGNKLATAFFYADSEAFSGLQSAMFGGPGDQNPTPTFYQIAETNRQSVHLGPSLVRLVSTDVGFIPGQHYNSQVNQVGTNWAISDLSERDFVVGENDPYIKAIAATNLGLKNNTPGGDKLRGDVVVGYFKPLSESFDGPDFENEIYFMIVNGLTDPTGTAAETSQLIRVDFDFGASGIDSLQRLSRDTGLVEVVDLIHDGGSLYHLDLILEGGTGDLFKFNTGAPFIVPEPAALTLTLLGALGVMGITRRQRRSSSRLVDSD